MAYSLHNETALLAAAQLIANALNITTSNDSSPPNAQQHMWHLKCNAAQRGIVVTTDQLTGHMDFCYTSGNGKKLTIRLNFWSPEVPTTITVDTESVTFNWNGIKMVAQHSGKLPELMRTLAGPAISRRKTGCKRQTPQFVRFQHT